MAGHLSEFRARTAGGLALVLALPLVLSAPFLADPFDCDEAVYGVVARMLLEGDQPYRDVFDHKPPGIYAWYALAFVAFGETEWGPRLLGALALSGTAAATMVAARMLWGGRAGWIGGVVLGASAGVAIVRPHANVEPFMLLPMCWALVLGLRTRTSGGRASAGAAGVLAAIACLTKPVAAGNAVIILGLCVMAPGRRRPGWAASGFISPFAGVAAWMVASGSLASALEANVTYNLRYTSEVPLSTKLWLLQFNGRLVVMAAGPLFLGGLIGAARMLARGGSGDWIALAWLAASAAGTAATGRFYGHYFVQLFPALALVAGGGLAPPPGWLWHPVAGRVLVAAAGFAAGFAVFMNAPFYTTASPAQRATARDGVETTDRTTIARTIGEQIKANTNADGAVLLLGRDTAVLWHAERPAASRFVYDMPLWQDTAARAEFVAELQRERAVVVVDWLDGLPGLNVADPAVVEVRETLREHYELAEVHGDARVYRRR